MQARRRPRLLRLRRSPAHTATLRAAGRSCPAVRRQQGCGRGAGGMRLQPATPPFAGCTRTRQSPLRQRGVGDGVRIVERPAGNSALLPELECKVTGGRVEDLDAVVVGVGHGEPLAVGGVGCSVRKVERPVGDAAVLPELECKVTGGRVEDLDAVVERVGDGDPVPVGE